MPESLSTPTDRTVVVRHGVLTYISLAFNGLILLLILIGLVVHHPRQGPKRDGAEAGFGHGGWAERDRGGDDFHHGGFMRRAYDRRSDAGDQGWCPRCAQDGPGMESRPGWENGRGPAFGEGENSHPGAGFDEEPGIDDRLGFNPGQPPRPPSSEEMTDRLMLTLAGKLALTDQESAQIRPLVQGDMASFQKDMDAQRDAHQKMIDDVKAKIRAALTPDQQKQFDEMTAQMTPPPPPK